MENQIKMHNYEFIIDMTAVAEACMRRLDNAGIKQEDIDSGEIRSAEARLARSLAPFGYKSEYIGTDTIYISLSIREDPMGYFWFGRDISGALVAAILARRCRNRRKVYRLWNNVYNEICRSITAACKSTPAE